MGLVTAVVLGSSVALTSAQDESPDPAVDSPVEAQESEPPRPRRGFRDPEKVHDPSTILGVEGIYRFFSTGRGVTLMRENAEGRWLPEGRLFSPEQLPEWHRELVPGNRGHLWAPDVIKLEDHYFVYYSVSTFGKNNSAIGLAVGETLDPTSPEWKWDDRGPVIVSQREDRFNAIDPAIFADDDGSLWMTFGSFWDGIHLIELDPKTGMRRDKDEAPRRLATAPEIEAPFLHKRNGYYYLFINWGKCCRGIESTYEIRVGRSETITGPYRDREGKDLKDEGGTLVLDTQGRFIGPGHASILPRNGREYLAHHFYDGENRGRSRLRLVELTWDEAGWPRVVVQ